MEDSLNSMMQRTPSSSSPSSSPSESSDESSWTMYIEDFMTSNHHYQDDQQHSSSHYSTSIIACDAASSVRKRLDDQNCSEEIVLGFSNNRSLSSPSYIVKRKAKKGLLHDDALEDTATSPANSPKVCSLYHSGNMKQNLQREKKDTTSKEKGSTSGNANETSPAALDFNETPESDYSGLKKKGLCLVPIPMVANYFG